MEILGKTKEVEIASLFKRDSCVEFTILNCAIVTLVINNAQTESIIFFIFIFLF